MALFLINRPQISKLRASSCKMSNPATVFELRCAHQKYQWGKVGCKSEVAKLLSSADPTFNVDEDGRYAELWMGTHPNGPSKVFQSGSGDQTLEQWVKDNPACLGDDVAKLFNGSLPFLFKVLSVDKALSIQAHPNKKHAEELHQRDPKNYKDSNHKPEMAIALTDFTGLCGFRPVKEIAEFMQKIPELRQVVGETNADNFVAASKTDDVESHTEVMRQCFTALMLNDKETIANCLKPLVERVRALDTNSKEFQWYVGDILQKLDHEFPGDVGGFSIYFLNVVRLKRGESIFLEANLPHAYLSGDCMECMACSDNVVRAGLTPKFIDTETLVKMLNYKGRSAEENKYLPKSSEENGCKIRKFTPPIKDFSVIEIKVPEGLKSTKLPAIPSASILICIEGEGCVAQSVDVKRGTILFISANQSADLTVQSANGMLLYRALAGL